MARSRETYEREYKTIRLLEIDGVYYVLQQQYRLYYIEEGKMSEGVSAEKLPTEKHRLVKLSELVDMEEVAADVLGGEGVDDMKEIK